MVFEAIGQAKASVGADRADIRWADINGDVRVLLIQFTLNISNEIQQGKADYIWIDKFLGTYQHWTNAGPGNPADNLGSHIHWDARGVSGGGGNLRGEYLDFSEYVASPLNDSLISRFEANASESFSLNGDARIRRSYTLILRGLCFLEFVSGWWPSAADDGSSAAALSRI
jgi:hypothetical protein